MNAARAAAGATVPVIVIGGYLGAGKTTLVNHLLRHAAGQRIAVLVNDFGDLAIDADLIEGEQEDVIALAGGCVCCSFGADLVGTLNQVVQRQPPPDVVLIETSGVGLPGAVARSSTLASGVQVSGIVVLADAHTLRERAADDYVGDTVLQQLCVADFIVLNKCELLAPPRLAELHTWLAGVAPGAPVVNAVKAQVPAELVLGVRALPRSAPEEKTWQPTGRMTVPAASRFDSHSLRFEVPQDVPAWGRRLTAPNSGVLRAKGVLRGMDGHSWLVQVVGRRASIEPVQHQARGGGELIIIGLRGAMFDTFGQRHGSARGPVPNPS